MNLATFTNDYLTGGSYVTTDVAELMSQGMEYMSLCYATEPSAQVLDTARQLKMADSLRGLCGPGGLLQL